MSVWLLPFPKFFKINQTKICSEIFVKRLNQFCAQNFWEFMLKCIFYIPCILMWQHSVHYCSLLKILRSQNICSMQFPEYNLEHVDATFSPKGQLVIGGCNSLVKNSCFKRDFPPFQNVWDASFSPIQAGDPCMAVLWQICVFRVPYPTT